jgi:chorismate mutase
MSDDPFYLIRRSHLPEVMRKTVEVSELLQRRRDLNILDAVQQVGISRSAYYKYKDAVKPLYSAMQGQIITISLTLTHIPGVLSDVLNTLSKSQANILTIDQSLPLQGIATVIISIETREMKLDITAVLDNLRDINGVEQVALVGRS